MRRGKAIATLSPDDLPLLSGVKHYGPNKERALLLLHGFSSTPAVFRALFTSLTQYDALIAPTLPGHGEDLNAFSQAKFTDWLSAVEIHCAKLCEEYAAVDVLGLSLGGLLACHLSKHFPLNHLYLLSPALALNLPVAATVTLARLLRGVGFNALRANAGNLFTDNHCEMAYRQLPLNAIIEVLMLIQQFEFTLPQCPTDVFLGKHDIVVNNQQVSALFPASSNIKLHWLDNSAHVLPLDGDIDRIIACLKK